MTIAISTSSNYSSNIQTCQDGDLARLTRDLEGFTLKKESDTSPRETSPISESVTIAPETPPRPCTPVNRRHFQVRIETAQTQICPLRERPVSDEPSPFTLLDFVAYRALLHAQQPCALKRAQTAVRKQQANAKQVGLELYDRLNHVCQVRIVTSMAWGIFQDLQRFAGQKYDIERALPNLRKFEFAMQEAMNNATDHVENFTYLYKYQCAQKVVMGLINARYEDLDAPLVSTFCQTAARQISREKIQIAICPYFAKQLRCVNVRCGVKRPATVGLERPQVAGVDSSAKIGAVASL